MSWRMTRFLTIALTLVTLSGLLAPGPAVAHPLDRIRQHLLIQLAPDEIHFTLAVGGGVLATDLVAHEVDTDGDESFSEGEVRRWAEAVLGVFAAQIAGVPLAIDPPVDLAPVPEVTGFRSGAEPLMFTFVASLPDLAEGETARLTVQNRYRLDRTDFLFDVQARPGVALGGSSWPSSNISVRFALDAAAPGTATSLEAAGSWGAAPVVSRARLLFERERTPQLLALMLGVFLVMGALHAIQPGHGKALAAAYLVATNGTPKDALALGGIVTMTHTASVFALGGATLLASHVFLPSTVLPIMEVVSGILVAALGMVMLRRAFSSRRHAPHHHHHHEPLSEDEHARLHAEEALAARVRFSRKGLVAMGVSGGLVPCPDALAILLLAIGLNQAAFGMVAIVAFSAGLAATLVGFGLAIVMAGPFWSRIRAIEGAGSWSGRLVRRAVAFAPVASAAVVFLLGAAMLWRAGHTF
jgi:ABC-type nickel/cobalt efflux system permease component RcnA